MSVATRIEYFFKGEKAETEAFETLTAAESIPVPTLPSATTTTLPTPPPPTYNVPTVPWEQAMDSLLDSGLSVWCGSTKSGKTNAIKCMLREGMKKKTWNKIYVQSTTAHFTGDFKCLPSKCIKEPDVEAIDALLKEQIQRHMSGYAKRKVLLILDDIIGELPTDRSCKTLTKLATSGRHYGIQTCLATQDLHQIGTTIRDNSQYLNLFSLRGMSQFKTLNDYQKVFDTERQFRQFYNDTCVDYNVIQFNNEVGQSRDNLLIFRPPIAPKFVVKMKR
jgi:hypothetical protein